MHTHIVAEAKPVLLIGKTVQTGTGVAHGLLPEYEVVHFMQDVDHAKSAIPAIFAGKATQIDTQTDTVGTLNFKAAPIAVILGGAFSEEMVEDLRKDVIQSSKGDGFNEVAVPWLMRGPDGEARMGPYGPKYAENVLKSVKATLKRIEDDNHLNKDGIHFW